VQTLLDKLGLNGNISQPRWLQAVLSREAGAKECRRALGLPFPEVSGLTGSGEAARQAAANKNVSIVIFNIFSGGEKSTTARAIMEYLTSFPSRRSTVLSAADVRKNIASGSSVVDAVFASVVFGRGSARPR